MKITVPYPIIDMVKTGTNIQRLREASGFTVAEVQHYLGLSNPQAIYHWQKGISLPTVDHLYALSILFGVSMNDVLVASDSPGPATIQTKKKPMMKPYLLLLAA